MKTALRLIALIMISGTVYAQPGWKLCNSPAFGNRVDDIFMLNTQTGYAVSGDGKIVKTTDGGNNWILMKQSNIYCRSVEFINTQKGFVGGFSFNAAMDTNILRRTTDGGNTWTDLSPLLHPRAKRGICGLAVADINTIYGGGNWFGDSAYIVKSVDGGNTWSFIDMSAYATSIIDLFFINKDVGFATGKGPLPLESGIILYTTNGGASWTTKFQNTVPNEYCWKIQRLNSKIYFASLEDFGNVPPKILKSTDGGMTWSIKNVAAAPYNIEGVGFIDEKKGWTGGDAGFSFQTNDGGVTWDTIHLCPYMNRVFKVNDTLLFASGDRIYKYNTGGFLPAIPASHYAFMNCTPNPVKNDLSIDISIAVQTRVSLMILDNTGRRVSIIENADKPKGSYHYAFNADRLPPGMYYVLLKTHEDKVLRKIIVTH
ncbi:MAG: T9SS type A sorting domain-containing protein [Ferruginibacter sp.]